MKTTNKSKINYQTDWTHSTLGKANALRFEANTPIEEIIKQAEIVINKQYSGLNLNYQKSRDRFTKLYYNYISEFKGWTVRYKSPDVDESYHPITEKINYKSKGKTYDLSKFKRPMIWKHELYPAVGVVKIEPFFNSGQIVQMLNEEMQKSSFDVLLKTWSPIVDGLKLHYDKMHMKNQPFLILACRINE